MSLLLKGGLGLALCIRGGSPGRVDAPVCWLFFSAAKGSSYVHAYNKHISIEL